MRDWLKSSAADESGAVTVDWVVLTSLVVILGVWALSLYTQGTLRATDEIDSYLSGITITN